CGLHVGDDADGPLLWSYPLVQRAVSAHYSLDTVLVETPGGKREVIMALPLLPEDTRGPRALGVRGTDVVTHTIGTPAESLGRPLVCVEEGIEKRRFWAIRLRALSQDARTLLTLSCGHVPGEEYEMAVVRRWELTARARFGGYLQPRIAALAVIGNRGDYTTL